RGAHGAPSTFWRKHSVADCSLRIGQWLVGVTRRSSSEAFIRGHPLADNNADIRSRCGAAPSCKSRMVANRKKWSLWGEPTAHQVADELRLFAITTLRWLPPLDAAAGRERG